jgi:hypothetical protein
MPTVLGQLTSLSLTTVGLPRQASDPTNKIMHTLGSICSKLCHLELFHSLHPDRKYYIDDLEDLLVGLKDRLHSLKLDGFCHKRRDGLQVGHSPFIQCSLLKKLYLGRCFSAEDIKAICRLGSLKEFTISYGDDIITDDDFQKAFEQQELISLESFELIGSHNFGKNAATALLKYCPNLKSLTCKRVQKIGKIIKVVSDCGPQMVKLKNIALVECTLDKNDIIVVASLYNIRELHMTIR